MIYKIGLKNLVIMTLIILVLIMFFIWQNNAITITNYSYVNSKIPKDFNGYSILQISDLHNKDFNEEKLESLNVEIIDNSYGIFKKVIVK